VTSGALIRQARTRAGLSQVELSQRSGKDRAQIARWERDVVQPSLETLRELLRACGWDVELALVPYQPDPKHDNRLRVRLGRTPQERLQGMLRERNRR
jgi:transcriptional regulator with XRE-family HTH domain